MSGPRRQLAKVEPKLTEETRMKLYQLSAHSCWGLLLILLLAVVVPVGYCSPCRSGLAQWPVVSCGAVDETNTRVTMLQYLLRSKGYSLPVNGRYDSRTQQAVQGFQLAHGLKPTGEVKACTWLTLITSLKPGSRGYAVCAIQVTLREVSESGLSVSGSLDARTEKAVRKFQKDNSLLVDGVVGRATWQQLTEDIYD